MTDRLNLFVFCYSGVGIIQQEAEAGRNFLAVEKRLLIFECQL